MERTFRGRIGNSWQLRNLGSCLQVGSTIFKGGWQSERTFTSLGDQRRWEVVWVEISELVTSRMINGSFSFGFHLVVSPS